MLTDSSRRLFAFDLDGTLFGADGQVSPRTRRALGALHEAGHALLAVTGRSYRTAVPRLAGVPGIERMIGSNGAYEYHLSGAEIRWHRPFTVHDAERWKAAIRQRFPAASFGWEGPAGIAYEDTFTHEFGVVDDLEYGNDCAADNTLVYKLYVHTRGETASALRTTLLPILAAEAEITISGAPFVEVSARGVDKATALARVATDLGFDRSAVVAFGDNQNDVPMLRWAGRSVAMGNAIAEVRQVADELALPHYDDGVAAVLERLFLQ